jgi:tetratricopeptide (TPR) repeat protein
MSKATSRAKGNAYTMTTSLHPAQKTWSYQAAFWGLTLLLILPPYFRGLFFAAEQQKALVLAAALFWLVWHWKHSRRDYTFVSHPLDYFVLALPLVYLLAVFNAVNYGLATVEFVKNILYFLVYWIIVQLAREETDISFFLHIIFFAATGVALAGLMTATGIVDIKDGFLGGRIYSTFQYPNALASYLAVAGFLGIYFWQRNSRLALADTITDRTLKNILPGWLLRLHPYGYLYNLANIILLAVLIGTKSRGGLLITAVVFILYIIGLNRSKRLPALLYTLFLLIVGYISIEHFIAHALDKHLGIAWLWIAAAIVVVLLAQAANNILSFRWRPSKTKKKKTATGVLAGLLGVVVIGGGVLVATQPALMQKIFSFSYLRNAIERTYFIKDALAMFKVHPLLGWGGGGWREAYRSFQGYFYNSNEVHSYYFQTAVETGMLGLLAVVGIWVTFFWILFRSFKNVSIGADRKSLLWTLFAAALAVGVHAAIDFDLSLSALTIALWAIFASVRVLVSLPEAQASVNIPVEQEKPKKYAPEAKKTSEAEKTGNKKTVAIRSDSQAAKRIRKGKEKISYKHITEMPPRQPLIFVIFSLVGVILLLAGIFLTMADTYSMEARKSLQSGKIQEALSNTQKAILYNPLNADNYTQLANIYLNTGKAELALANAQRAAELSQYSAAKQVALATAYLSTNKYDDVIRSAKRAVELAPYQESWYEYMAYFYSAVGQDKLLAGDKDEARIYLEETLQVPALIQDKINHLGEREKRLWVDAPMLSVTPGLKLYTGQANYLLGNIGEAEKELQVATGNEQAKSEALIWLALVKEKQGKAQEAKDLVKQATDINQNYSGRYDQLKALPTL